MTDKLGTWLMHLPSSSSPPSNTRMTCTLHLKSDLLMSDLLGDL